MTEPEDDQPIPRRLIDHAAVVARITERVDALAGISETDPAEERGVTRLAFTELERRAHDLAVDWARAAGATVHRDAIGNTILTYRPQEPYLLVGSHLDSVAGGGRYDGTIGVLAALEVAEAVQGHITQGLRVVVFSAEEGARFKQPCLGSSVAAGDLDAAGLGALYDSSTPPISALEAARELELMSEDFEPWVDPEKVTAFLEVHIEQGTVLESERLSIGVVDAIAGAARLGLTLRGRPEHSGATPMRIRADALAAASEIVLAVEEIGRRTRGGTATIGQLTVTPNGITTVPGKVVAGVDIRDTDKGQQEASVVAFRRATAEIVDRRGESHQRAITCEITPAGSRDPVMLSAWVRKALKDACEASRINYRIMPSGAGHDAAILAARVPAGMLFVASPNGLSHVPEEACNIEDVTLACGIMCDALLLLDKQSPGARR